MAFIGGDATEVTYNHPVLGTGTVYCKASEDSTLDRGGYMKDDDNNNVSGDGQIVFIMNRKRWKAELPPILWDMTERDELGRLQEIQNHPLPASWTIAYANGAIYSGRGSVVGDLNATTNNPHISVTLAGGGTLDKTN